MDSNHMDIKTVNQTEPSQSMTNQETRPAADSGGSHKHSFRELFHYRFDTFMARRGASIFISLVLVFFVLLLFAGIIRGAIYVLFPEIDIQSSRDVFENIYISFLQMSDPGNMALDMNASLLIKAVGILAGIAGMVMFSALIALITTALDQKINSLKKGHSKVIEDGHTLILGWNEQRVIEILRELIEANESEPDPAVVILSEKDKEDMDDYLGVNLIDRKNTRIITRSGSVSSMVNLEIVSVSTCKSVIALASSHEGATEAEKTASDAKVIKTILAVVAFCSSQKKLNVVAEVFNPRNRRILEDISPQAITTIDTRDILAKILVQTSRSTGLAMVYSEILSFKGCELYFYNDVWGEVSFGELSYHFPDGIPLGIRYADKSLIINPPAETKISSSDDILILAEDDSTIEYQSAAVVKPESRNPIEVRHQLGIEKELLLGWTPKAEIILEQYGDYVLDGSSIDIMLQNPTDATRSRIEYLQDRLSNLSVTLIDKDPLELDNLLSISPSRYDNIIILGKNGGDIDAERADAETLIILLLLRRILDRDSNDNGGTKLITEVLESRNQELVTRAGVDNFVISNQIVSMIMAQISENQDMKRVYDHLFQEDGSEIYIKSAALYFESFPVELRFADLMQIAQKRGEVCLGVKLQQFEKDLNRNFGIKLNPGKEVDYVLTAKDALVVLAEDET
jgi:ion channel POLLUX/CASTOR